MARDSFSGYALASISFVLFILLLSVVPARAQSGDDALRFSQRFPGVTATSIGSAGVGIAGVSDASAMFVNPAGLGLAGASSFSVSFSTLSVNDEGVFRLPGSFSTIESDGSRGDLSSLAYLYKYPTTRGSFVFAVSFNQVSTWERELAFDGFNDSNSITDFFLPLSNEVDFEFEGDEVFPVFSRTLSFIGFETFAIDFDQNLFDSGDPVPFWPAVSAGTVRQAGSVTEEGRQSELNFGAAFEASKGIFLGASVNIPFGKYKFFRILEETDIDDANDGRNGTTDFDFLRFTQSFESDMVGVNVRAGLSAQVSPDLRVGFSLESPTLLSVEEDFRTILSTEFDNGDAFIYGDDRSESEGSGVFEYEITTPWHLGAGLSYKTSGVTLSADAEWIDWSQLELRADDLSFDDENRRISQQFDAVINLRMGATYEMGPYTFRGGIAFYPDPHDATFTSPVAGSVDRDRTYFSAGIGYMLSRYMKLDFGWMQERFNDVYRVYTEVTDAPYVEEEVVRNRFQFGLTYLF